MAKGDLRHRRSRCATRSYDALTGADALAIVTEWNEFREPDFAQDAQADAHAGHLRRPQHLQSPSRCGRTASPTTRLAAEHGGCPRHRRRRLHRQPRRQGAGARRADRSSSTTTCRPATARRPLGGARRGRATSTTSARLRARHAPSIACDAVMHFAAWLSVGDSVRDPRRLLPQQRVGDAVGARRDGGARGSTHFVFSSTRAIFGEPRRDANHRERTRPRPINAYGETKLAVERALPHFERAYGIQLGRAALLQRGGRGSGRRARRGSRARAPPHPARHRRGRRAARRSADLRRRLPDARRHLPARLHPRDRPRGRARAARSRRCERERGRALQSRQRPPALGQGRDRHRSSASRAGRCRTRSRPAGARRPRGAVRVE